MFNFFTKQSVELSAQKRLWLIGLALAIGILYDILVYKQQLGLGFFIFVSVSVALFLILAIVFWGLAAFHHQTAVLLAPAYLWVIIKSSKNFKKIKRVHLKLIGAFLTGAIPYLYVFWAAWRKTPVNWNDPSNLPNFWRLITRADYGTFTASPELIGFSLKARAVQLIWYFNAVKADFTVLGVLLAVIGAVWLYFNNRLWFWFLTLAFLFSGPFFVSYASFPPVESFLLGVSERFFLTSYLFLAIFVGFGMFAVFNLFVRISSIYFKKKEVLARLTIGLAFLIFPLILALINWPKTDLSQYKLGKILAEDILNNITLEEKEVDENIEEGYWENCIDK